jgi:hypothetical protein
LELFSLEKEEVALLPGGLFPLSRNFSTHRRHISNDNAVNVEHSQGKLRILC